jgi:DNA polymerase
MLIIDFETRSRCSIERGAHVYAADPSTDILCMAACDTETGEEWLWYPQHPLDLTLWDLISNPATTIGAFNAEFDQAIWECIAVNDYGFPEVHPDRWYCIAAQSRVNAGPGNLKDASLFWTGKQLKNPHGARLIRLLSMPDPKTGQFRSPIGDLHLMGEYCADDVRATVAVFNACRQMDSVEQKDYHVCQRINERGVRIDTELARLASRAAGAGAEFLNKRLTDLTDGAVTRTTQTQRLREYIQNRLHDKTVHDYMTRIVEKKGNKPKVKVSLDSSTRANLLAAADEDLIELPDKTREVIETMEDGNKSSVAKFQKMLLMADDSDQRVRGAYLYAGAGQTLRFSARGLQVHNFPRACYTPEKTAEVRQILSYGVPERIEGEPVVVALKKLLRPAIVPTEGNLLVVSDWAQIEARILPWLADDSRADTVLNVFRAGEDVYTHAAKGMNIDDRQIGKVATLALGFGGGVKAFDAMARNYGLSLTTDHAQHIVDKWRAANAWATRFWARLENAAMAAVRNPGTEYFAGRVAFQYVYEHEHFTLVCYLPDGSEISYPFAELGSVDTPWGEKRSGITYAKANVRPPATSDKWPKVSLYSGLLAENVTQATAACFLRRALTRCEEEGLSVVLHTHDEIVVETPEAEAEKVTARLKAIMEEVPKWAEGVPMLAEPTVMSRYGK